MIVVVHVLPPQLESATDSRQLRAGIQIMLKAMYNPTLRLLTLLELLESTERVSGTALASKLEVSLRSVQRYVAQLQDLGIPVESTRGVGGAYRLKPGFRLPPLMLTDDEALAVSLGLRTLESLGLSAFAPATASALSKLKRVLPKNLTEQVSIMQEAIELEPSSWLVATDTKLLRALAKAVQVRVAISFAYQAFDGTKTRREVEPYSVLYHDGRWYMVGHCRLRHAVRSFRLDRMLEVLTLGEHFHRPELFDARTYLRQSLPFAASTFKVEVWLDLPPEEARWRVMPHKVALEAEGDGTVLRCGTADLEWMAAVLLSLKCVMMIRQPTALFEAFELVARQACLIATRDS
jgi:predicted DNA-binding transcriptional regulator YafY